MVTTDQVKPFEVPPWTSSSKHRALSEALSSQLRHFRLRLHIRRARCLVHDQQIARVQQRSCHGHERACKTSQGSQRASSASFDGTLGALELVRRYYVLLDANL